MCTCWRVPSGQRLNGVLSAERDPTSYALRHAPPLLRLPSPFPKTIQLHLVEEEGSRALRTRDKGAPCTQGTLYTPIQGIRRPYALHMHVHMHVVLLLLMYMRTQQHRGRECYCTLLRCLHTLHVYAVTVCMHQQHGMHAMHAYRHAVTLPLVLVAAGVLRTAVHAVHVRVHAVHAQQESAALRCCGVNTNTVCIHHLLQQQLHAMHATMLLYINSCMPCCMACC